MENTGFFFVCIHTQLSTAASVAVTNTNTFERNFISSFCYKNIRMSEKYPRIFFSSFGVDRADCRLYLIESEHVRFAALLCEQKYYQKIKIAAACGYK